MNPFSIKLAGLVALFGALGILARFTTVHFVARHFPSFPMGTFLVNMVGSFLIGCVFSYWGARSDLSPMWKILLVTGFLGGFTTFSSFSMELLEFYREGRILTALLYGVGSPVLGVVAAAFGAFVTGLRLS